MMATQIIKNIERVLVWLNDAGHQAVVSQLCYIRSIM